MVHERISIYYLSIGIVSDTPKASIRGAVDRCLGKMSVNWPPSSSRVYGVQLEDPREGYLWLQSMRETNRTLIVLSRLSPKRLSRYIDLNSIDFHWITSHDDKHAIDPALERLNHHLSSRILEDSGIIWLDAVEYLSDLHGFDAMMHFVQSLSDSLTSTDWTLVLPYSPLAFKPTDVAKIRREAPNYDISMVEGENDDTVSISGESKLSHSEEDSMDDSDDSQKEATIEVEPGLHVLSRIPEKSLSRAILQRRLEQWKEMGFDVSELEPVMLVNDRSIRHQRYFSYEEKVRRATECERRIRELEALGFTTESTKLHFKIMQLTSLDEVERQIERLLEEAR